MDRRGDEELATRKDFARMAGVSPKTIHRWTESGYCPKPFKVGGMDRWRFGTIRRWLLEIEISERVGGTERDRDGHDGTFGPPADIPPSKKAK